LTQDSFQRRGDIGRLVDHFLSETLQRFAARRFDFPVAFLKLFDKLRVSEHLGERPAQ